MLDKQKGFSTPAETNFNSTETCCAIGKPGAQRGRYL
jgi:hypothetical protein